LPKYSPELNPAELIWAYLKTKCLNKLVMTSMQHFIETIEEKLSMIGCNKELCKSFFKKDELAYIFDETNLKKFGCAF
jgi:transposase